MAKYYEHDKDFFIIFVDFKLANNTINIGINMDNAEELGNLRKTN